MSNTSFSCSSMDAVQYSKAPAAAPAAPERKQIAPVDQKRLYEELWDILLNDSDNIDAVRKVLAEGADPNCYNFKISEAITPLQYATIEGKAALVELFLSYNTVNPNQLGYEWQNRWSLLGYALYQVTFNFDEKWANIVESFLSRNDISLGICTGDAIRWGFAERKFLVGPKNPPGDFAGFIEAIGSGRGRPRIGFYVPHFFGISISDFNKLKSQLLLYQKRILARTERHEADVKALDAKLTAAVAFSGNLATELEQTQTELAQKQFELTAAVTAYEKLVNEFEQQNKKITQLESEQQSLTKTFQELQANSSVAARRELESKLEDLQVQLNAANGVKKALAEQMAKSSQASVPSSSASCPAVNPASAQAVYSASALAEEAQNRKNQERAFQMFQSRPRSSTSAAATSPLSLFGSNFAAAHSVSCPSDCSSAASRAQGSSSAAAPAVASSAAAAKEEVKESKEERKLAH